MRIAAILCVFVLVGAAPATAQAPDERAVRDAVEAFLLHLGDGDFDRVSADLAPKAIVIVARERPAAGAGQAAQWANSYQTGEEWLDALKRNTVFTRFREPLANVKVTIDSGSLAYVRADFRVVRDGKAVSHGVDQFVLTRESGVWKLAAIAYTSMPLP